MKRFLLFFFFIIVLLTSLSFVGYRFFIDQIYNTSVDASNVMESFEILEGQSAKEIGFELEKTGIIKNKNYFYYYIWKNDLAAQIQAGKYELSSNMTIPQVVEKFVQGLIKKEIKKITIPEGFTNRKIIDRLRGLEPAIADRFEELVNCKCLNQDGCACDLYSSRYDFLALIPNGIDMEGYLFPDTYFIEKDDTAEIMLEKFLNNFSRHISLEDLEQIEKTGRNIFEIVTMASVIEREVQTDKDRKIVSGIFWKRIEDEYPLQSCATLAYFLEIDKPQFSYEDTQIESPYNTYLNIGLPPGPIANPGEASIKAAIYPQKNDYYYFLSDLSSGEIIYSKTLEEHNANKIKYGL
jgi:UPF0755 protein